MSGVEAENLMHELMARMEIEKLVSQLARAMDRNDREAMVACYHPGAFDHHSEFDGPVEQFVDWIDALYRERLDCMSHVLGNRVLEIRGDSAYGEIYVMALVKTKAGDGEPQFDSIAAGRYLDHYERRAGRWRIAERTVVLDWQRTDPVPAAFDGPATVDVQLRGKTSGDDVSYAHFMSARQGTA